MKAFKDPVVESSLLAEQQVSRIIEASLYCYLGKTKCRIATVSKSVKYLGSEQNLLILNYSAQRVRLQQP